MVKTTYNLPTPYIRNSRIAALKLALLTLCHHMEEVVWGDYEISNHGLIDKDRTSVSEIHHDVSRCHYSSI